MKFSKKQIKYIELNRNNLTHVKIAENLNVSSDAVKKHLDENPVKKTPVYFYLILILIPLLFFVLLEAGLRLFNYGYNLSMWVEVADGKYMMNWDVSHRYFYTVKSNPTSIKDIFDKEKDPNAFRVFVVGESSAAGYPYLPMGSFSRYIRKRLELNYPKNKIEVINTSLSATNSFTIRDFIPEILEQKPDLILLYAGHNEYYGALGVGSQESVASSPRLVNFLLYMNKFKTTQLIRDILKLFVEVIADDNSDPASGTLMSRMAAEKEIEFNSEKFNAGLEQFKNNMIDIVEMAKDQNVPLIISTLASNLKDQAPFISIEGDTSPPANKIFNNAKEEFASQNLKVADSLFRYAKDLDGLRFRAPEKINTIIKNIARDFSVPIIDADSLFAALSEDGIVGDNLMTDHLHPTLEGNKAIGDLFYKKMRERNILPKNSKEGLPIELQHELTSQKFVFSTFDSVVADYRIRLLKNDWPFIDPKLKKSLWEICIPKNYIDTTAVQFLLGNKSWDYNVENIADESLRRGNLNGFIEHMRVLIYQYPIMVELYDKLEATALSYIKSNEFGKAADVLNLEYELKPNAFCAKWLGQIELTKGNTLTAINFLEESLSYNSEDEQVMYNLSGAYALLKNYKKSYEVIAKLLAKNPNHAGANKVINQLRPLI